MSLDVASQIMEYKSGLAEIKEALNKKPVSWWAIYPKMVRVQELAINAGMPPPFSKQQLKDAKEKLFQQRTNPPSLTF
uniref:Uncharacterized protein n=1 Tax=Shewanella decolorationis TaxID=256839 RepID=A0A5B8QWX3_9GAMM